MQPQSKSAIDPEWLQLASVLKLGDSVLILTNMFGKYGVAMPNNPLMETTVHNRPRISGGLYTPTKEAIENGSKPGVLRLSKRTLMRDDLLYESEELKYLKFDIIGLSEMRREREEYITLRSENVLN